MVCLVYRGGSDGLRADLLVVVAGGGFQSFLARNAKVDQHRQCVSGFNSGFCVIFHIPFFNVVVGMFLYPITLFFMNVFGIALGC